MRRDSNGRISESWLKEGTRGGGGGVTGNKECEEEQQNISKEGERRPGMGGGGEATRIKRPGGAQAIVPPRKAATWMLPHGLPGLSACASPSLASPFHAPSLAIFHGSQNGGGPLRAVSHAGVFTFWAGVVYRVGLPVG